MISNKAARVEDVTSLIGEIVTLILVSEDDLCAEMSAKNTTARTCRLTEEGIGYNRRA